MILKLKKLIEFVSGQQCIQTTLSILLDLFEVTGLSFIFLSLNHDASKIHNSQATEPCELDSGPPMNMSVTSDLGPPLTALTKSVTASERIDISKYLYCITCIYFHLHC